jgi:hypothetical protein
MHQGIGRTYERPTLFLLQGDTLELGDGRSGRWRFVRATPPLAR